MQHPHTHTHTHTRRDSISYELTNKKTAFPIIAENSNSWSSTRSYNFMWSSTTKNNLSYHFRRSEKFSSMQKSKLDENVFAFFWRYI